MSQSRAIADVLVIVPTLGTRPKWLTASLKSVLDQKEINVRLLVVSPIAAPEVLDSELLDRIEFAVFTENGLSRAINFGFDQCEEEFVTWLGDDDLLAPNTLSDSIALMRSKPEAPFLYGRTRYIDEGGRTIGFTRPTRLAAGYLPYGKNFVPQPGSVLRASSLESWGRLRTELRNAMDLDMFLGLRSYGRAIYRPAELSAYRLHRESITVAKGADDEAEMVRKEHRSPNAAIFAPVWRPLTRILDRLLDAGTRRFLVPSVPADAGGHDYTAELS